MCKDKYNDMNSISLLSSFTAVLGPSVLLRRAVLRFLYAIARTFHIFRSILSSYKKNSP